MDINRRTTIFRQLILNIVFPVVIALLLLAVLNYWNSKTNLVKWNEMKNDIITDEIKNIHTFQDLALEILENNLDKRTSVFSEILVNRYFKDTKNIEKVDLLKIRKEIGMDPEREDIYIINRDGIIINTTFEQDKNLNLFGFGEEHKNYLLHVFDSGGFVSERITIEAKTKRLKKYTYQPTKDGKYIIELGVYSSQADEIVNFIKNRLEKLPEKHESIVDVDIYVGAEKPFSLYRSATTTITHPEIVQKVFSHENSESIVENKDGKRLHYEYIYFSRKGTALYKGSVIQIVSDRTGEIILLRTEMIKFLIIFGITIFIVILLIYRKTKVITEPIKKLVENVNRITNGHLDERAEVLGNNEITSLSEKFNIMIEQLESYYNELEQKVRERTYEIYQQKEEIEAQRDALEEQRNMLADRNTKLEHAYKEIEQQKKNITDSIIYAKRIQTAILPGDDEVHRLLPNSFILYQPKDIVSGDFYWLEEVNRKVYIAAVDCTGHGVPGAFMSIVGYNQLNYAIDGGNDKKPSEILNQLNFGVTHILKQTSNVSSIRDGMDIALCAFDPDFKKVSFAGAYNPIIHIRNGELTLIKGDKFPIGAFIDEEIQTFTNHEIDLEKGDMIYIFSDGYVDQFGGDQGKKYLIKNFKDFLLSIYKEPLELQKELLISNLEKWKMGYPQIDDIMVIGIRI